MNNIVIKDFKMKIKYTAKNNLLKLNINHIIRKYHCDESSDLLTQQFIKLNFTSDCDRLNIIVFLV